MRSLIFFMSGEMLYHEDPKFFRAGRWPIIRYNKIHYLDNIFSWSSWGGHSHAQLYKLIFMYIGQTIVCVTDWWYGHIILWFGWSSVRQWCTLDVFIFLNISQPGWMKLDPGSSKLVQSSLGVQVDPCEKCFGVEHGKTSPDYWPMMWAVNRRERNHQ